MNSGWYFHNAAVSIDSDCALSNKADFPAQTKFATTTFYRLINPVSGWRAFNPNDNARLAGAKASGATEPIPVGYMQMLYHVIETKSLEPIYWSCVVQQPARIHYASWVFAATQTPIDPAWDAEMSALYTKLKPWTVEYLEGLESARHNPELLSILATRITFLQGSQPLDITILFEPGTERVAHLFSSARFTATKKLASELILHKAPKEACQTVVAFDWQSYQAIHKYEEEPFQQIGYKPPEITSLILVFHGIGQKLSEKIESVNFTYAIESLRVLIHSLSNKRPVLNHVEPNVRFLVLPVHWRAGLSFDVNEESFPLEEITPPTIPLVRRAVTDILMDFPYYMSHHRQSILDSAAAEANRLYDLVCKYNPSFRVKGSVNLIGHSLGSLICADILSTQPNSCEEKGALFSFNTRCFFTTGSPLAFFLHLHHANIIPRALLNPHEKPALGCFAVERLYNLINYSDVLAFMLNPAVKGNPVKEPRILERLPHACDNKRFSFFSRARGTSSKVQTTPELHLLNDYGQLDWILPIGARTFENQYLKIFTAHFDYWNNVEFATFVAIECGRRLGTETAVEEYKVMASQV